MPKTFAIPLDEGREKKEKKAKRSKKEKRKHSKSSPKPEPGPGVGAAAGRHLSVTQLLVFNFLQGHYYHKFGAHLEFYFQIKCVSHVL